MPSSIVSDLLCASDLPMSGDCIENASPAVIADAISEASEIIHRMSGGRVYGTRDATVRPAEPGCGWVGACANHCSVPTIRLGEDVTRIRWVRIDGEMLDPSAYTVVDKNKLIRTDGQAWPHCQDLTKDLSEVGSFGVRYSFGPEVDRVTMRALVDTTLELIKVAVPDADNRRLPANVRNASVNGLSLSMEDRNKLVRELGSYLESVNRFMALHNPMNEPPTFVYSPDTSPRLHARGQNG